MLQAIAHSVLYSKAHSEMAVYFLFSDPLIKYNHVIKTLLGTNDLFIELLGFEGDFNNLLKQIF